MATTAGRGGGQIGWYVLASKLVKDEDVVDVGCGSGAGIKVLTRTARNAFGIDLDPRLAGTNIKIIDISEIPSKSIDVAVCIDVIEHVLEDANFINELIRISRKRIIISTPNWAASRCNWPYHIREYMPHQFVELFAGASKISLYKGSSNGEVYYPVLYRKTYFLINKLRVFSITSQIMRVVNNLIPNSFRIHSHSFLEVYVH